MQKVILKLLLLCFMGWILMLGMELILRIILVPGELPLLGLIIGGLADRTAGQGMLMI